MPHFDVVVECPVHESFRVAKLGGMFDVPIQEKATRQFSADLPDLDDTWNIGAIIGPSGSGKSTIAREAFGNHLAKAGRWARDKAVIDGFPGEDVSEIVAMLTSVGFSSPPSWIKPFHVLSNGEQFRCELARALLGTKKLCVFDEFTSVVDRTVAQLGSAAVAKTVRRRGIKFVAVTCHSDVVDWLEADWVVDMAQGTLERRLLQRPTIELEIRKADRSLWRLFEPHHYLSATIPAASYVYVALWRGRPVACVVVSGIFGYAGRKRISRVVVMPDYQGVGIGGRVLDEVARLTAAGARYLGYYRHGQAIALGVENLSTWAHELCHAADYRLGTLEERGQHWRSETVAELGGAILLEILGYETEADRGGCWDYIQRYAKDAEIEPITACMRVLKRTCDAVASILDCAESIRDRESAPSGCEA